MKSDDHGTCHYESNKKIPAWLMEQTPPCMGNGKLKAGFLKKTVREFYSVLQNEIFSGQFTARQGYLQMIDSRVKLLTLIFFTVFASFAQSPVTLLLLAAASFVFALRSRLSIRDYAKRVWMILPLFVLLFSLPAATNLFVSGAPVVPIYKDAQLQLFGISLPQTIYFTDIGLVLILKMSMRTGVSLSFAYLLMMTTPWSSITKALLAFRMPAIVIAILDMAYRYLFLLAKLAAEMMEARFLRTAGASKSTENRLFVAQRMSFLFIKTSYLSDEIYDAMRARGYRGEPVNLTHFRLHLADALWIVNSIVILFVLGLGEWLW